LGEYKLPAPTLLVTTEAKYKSSMLLGVFLSVLSDFLKTFEYFPFSIKLE
jgi:hypothetical protein